MTSRTAKARARAQYAADFERVAEGLNGLSEVQLVSPQNLLSLFELAMNGERSAARAIGMLLPALKAHAGRDDALCGGCDHRFSPGNTPAAFAMWTPRNDELAGEGMAIALCDDCARPETINARIMAMVRRVQPNARTVALENAPGGHGHA